MLIEGEPSPPYTLCEQNADGSAGRVFGRFDTIQEARAASRQLDRLFVLLKGRKRLPRDWREKDY